MLESGGVYAVHYIDRFCLAYVLGSQAYDSFDHEKKNSLLKNVFVFFHRISYYIRGV